MISERAKPAKAIARRKGDVSAAYVVQREVSPRMKGVR
jgi:hypothetical protein